MLSSINRHSSSSTRQSIMIASSCLNISPNLTNWRPIIGHDSVRLTTPGLAISVWDAITVWNTFKRRHRWVRFQFGRVACIVQQRRAWCLAFFKRTDLFFQHFILSLEIINICLCRRVLTSHVSYIFGCLFEYLRSWSFRLAHFLAMKRGHRVLKTREAVFDVISSFPFQRIMMCSLVCLSKRWITYRSRWS